MTIQVDWCGPPKPIPPDYVYRNPPEPFFLAPKAVEPSAIIEMPSAAAIVTWSLNPIGLCPFLFGGGPTTKIFSDAAILSSGAIDSGSTGTTEKTCVPGSFNGAITTAPMTMGAGRCGKIQSE
jgi:hypothetical protein